LSNNFDSDSATISDDDNPTAGRHAPQFSGDERRVFAQLRAAGLDPRQEPLNVEYIQPARTAKYVPDFQLPNGIIVEVKGVFRTDDRQMHRLIKEQRPDLDIRFVFTNPNQRISKKRPVTYADWCEKNGFKYAKQRIPEAWLREKPRQLQQRQAAIAAEKI
jgi:hypothetical protein